MGLENERLNDEELGFLDIPDLLVGIYGLAYPHNRILGVSGPQIIIGQILT
jgi:hypothetical protein